MNGSGIFQQSNGSTMQGNFVNDFLEGHGKKEFAGGDYFEGYFCSGVRNGFGKYRWIDGSLYSGEWVDDCMHGLGSIVGSMAYKACTGSNIHTQEPIDDDDIDVDRHRYIRYFDNKRGKLGGDFSVLEYYFGQFESNYRHGFGKAKFIQANQVGGRALTSNGGNEDKVFEGDWRNGKYHGNLM